MGQKHFDIYQKNTKKHISTNKYIKCEFHIPAVPVSRVIFSCSFRNAKIFHKFWPTIVLFTGYASLPYTRNLKTGVWLSKQWRAPATIPLSPILHSFFHPMPFCGTLGYPAWRRWMLVIVKPMTIFSVCPPLQWTSMRLY